MSLSKVEMSEIKEVVQTAVSGCLVDIATSQTLAVDLIEDTLRRLAECQTHLAALTADLTRARRHEIDAETAVGLYRDLVERYQERLANSDALAEQQRERIKELERRVRELELKMAAINGND